MMNLPRTKFVLHYLAPVVFVISLCIDSVEAIGPQVTVSSPDDSFVNAIEGFGTNLQCFVNPCVPSNQQVKWYKEGKLIIEGVRSIYNNSRWSIRHAVDVDRRKSCQGSCSSVAPCQAGYICLDNTCCLCGKEEFSLAINNLTKSDSGVYQCKLDSSNYVEFQLNVLDSGLLPTFSDNFTFDHSDCCAKNGVSEQCRPMCKPKSMDTTKFDPISCQQETGKLLKCTSQNGNASHTHCCRLEYVPQFCWEYCSDAESDFGKANHLCVYWMREIFQCYERSYLPLPGHPEQLSVTINNSTSFLTCWKPPRTRPETVRFYSVRYQEVPRLPFFSTIDDDFDDEDYDAEELPPIPHYHLPDDDSPTTVTPIFTPNYGGGDSQLRGRRKRQTLIIATHNFETNETDVREYQFREINTTKTCTNIIGLKPLTPYTIYVTATNDYGTSLPSVKARAVTAEAEFSNTTLPNILKCCADRGVQEDCASKMCDVAQLTRTTSNFNTALTCRSELSKVAPCLADGRDHTDCCLSKNVGTECLKLCNGSDTYLAPSSVLCLSLDMASIYTCLRHGYETHPSPPTNVIVSRITDSSAVVTWSPPKDNSDKVSSYSIFYKPVSFDQFQEVTNVVSPFDLEGLDPDSEYSVYLIAYTPAGKSLKSTTITFYTGERAIDDVCAYGQPLRDAYGNPTICGGKRPCPTLFECVDSENDDDDAFYCCPKKPFVEPEAPIRDRNVTSCCASRGVSEKCLKLCSYETTAVDLTNSGRDCAVYLQTWLECATDGRDNRPCCAKQRVQDPPCADFCYVSPDERKVYTSDHLACAQFVKEISQCSLEGIYSLPGPPRYLRYLVDGPTWATIRWDKPSQVIDIDYYEVVLGNGTDERTLNSTSLSVTLHNLRPGVQYTAKVRSVNSRGASIFTRVLTFGLGEATVSPTWSGDLPSPPSNCTVEWYRDRTANVSWTWTPETFERREQVTNYDFNVSYGESLANGSRVNWKSVISKKFFIVLENLTDNKTYDLFVRARDLDTKVDGIPGPIVSFAARAARSPPKAEFVTIPDGPFDVGEKLELSCVGSGDPLPNVTMEGYGRLLSYGRGLATVYLQVTSEDDQNEEVLCTADNGNFVPFRTTYSLKIRSQPHASTLADSVHVIQDTQARLLCQVRSYPFADVTWFYQSENDKRQNRKWKELQLNAKFGMDVAAVKNRDFFNATLTVYQAENKDAGYYYCKACNEVGCSNASISLIVDPYPVPTGPDYALDCCKKQHVRSDCMSVCTSDIDMNIYETNLHCLDEFPKLMFCAKDGVDSSECCSRYSVPDFCVPYCNRRLITDDAPVMLNACNSYTSDIITCVEAGHTLVPPTPANIRIRLLSHKRSANISWTSPNRYDRTIPMYVIYYKHQWDSQYDTERTEKRWLVLSDLDPVGEYNVTVIAANQYGFSSFAPVISFGLSLDGAGTPRRGRNGTGTAIAVFLFILIIVTIIVAAVYFTRRRPRRLPDIFRKIRSKWRLQNGTPCRADGSVAFENPGYDTEAHVRVIPGGTNGNATIVSPTAATTDTNGSTWERPDLETMDDATSKQQRGMRYTQFS